MNLNIKNVIGIPIAIVILIIIIGVIGNFLIKRK
ncbi:hypothetical protein EZN00_01575 [Clostridium tyrobutyricum]|jgi:hypothetical protein|nr:hypothetical protein EZN00_01575 [Clostridium tyrobutyricum]